MRAQYFKSYELFIEGYRNRGLFESYTPKRKRKTIFKRNPQKELQEILDEGNDQTHFLKEHGYSTDEMTIGEVYEVLLILKRKAERQNKET